MPQPVQARRLGSIDEVLVSNAYRSAEKAGIPVVNLMTVQGLQAANATGVKISSHDGTLAWYGADQALRMMTGQPSNQNVQFPYVRMFNADNVGEIDLTPEAEKSGSWYGSTDYQDGFLELWGVS